MPDTFTLRGAARRWFNNLLNSSFGGENSVEPPTSGRQPPLELISSIQPVIVVNRTEFTEEPPIASDTVAVTNPRDSQDKPLPLYVTNAGAPPEETLNVTIKHWDEGVVGTVRPQTNPQPVQSPATGLFVRPPEGDDRFQVAAPETAPLFVTVTNPSGGGGGLPYLSGNLTRLYGRKQVPAGSDGTRGQVAFSLGSPASFKQWAVVYQLQAESISTETPSNPVGGFLWRYWPDANNPFEIILPRITAYAGVNATQAAMIPPGGLPMRFRTGAATFPYTELLVSGGIGQAGFPVDLKGVVQTWNADAEDYPFPDNWTIGSGSWA